MAYNQTGDMEKAEQAVSKSRQIKTSDDPWQQEIIDILEKQEFANIRESAIKSDDQ